MYGRNDNHFPLTNEGPAKGIRRHRGGLKTAPLLFATGLVACFWAARTSQGQIEVDAYITNQTSNNVSIINTTSGAISTLNLAPNFGPIGATVTPDGRFAYITNGGGAQPGSNTISVLDVATNTLVTTITPTPVQFAPAGVAVTPDAKFAYVANRDSGTVSVIDTTTNTVTVTIPGLGGTQLQGVAITPDGKLAYVTDALAVGTVSVINTATNTLVGAPIVVGSLPVGVAITPNGAFAYVGNQGTNTVSVINTATNAVSTIDLEPTLGVTAQPLDVAITPDGKFVYVTSGPTSTVSVIATATNAVVDTIQLPIGSRPAGVSVTPNGEFVFVVNFDSDTVSQIDVATNTVIKTFDVGTNPRSLGSFLGPNLIVAPGGPLSVASDAALTPLGFGTFVDFNGGTLRTTGSLVTARTISLLALGGTIDTNGFDSVFSGAIINTGSLTKTGAGTLTLSGVNTYTGGTAINGGTLAIGADVNLGAASGGVSFSGGTLQTLASFTTARAITLNAGGGTFEANGGTTLTDTGTIAGLGGLTKTGAGAVILEGNDSFTGGTTVLAGTLRAGSAGAFVNQTAYTVNGGTLDLNNFNLAMSSLNGSGGVVNLGAAALTVNNTGTNLYSGIIQGSGSLTKLGAGALTLAGDNTYSGGTTIDAGTLIVSSAQALGLGNVVVNGGILKTNSQPINVQGAYTQNAGGTLQLSLGGSAPGQYDVLNVAGRAALDGTLQLFALNGFLPKTGDKLTLILANGGVSGEFANFVNPFNALVGLELLYLPDSVVLEFMVSGFTPFALTPNEKAVARELDKVSLDPREAELISSLRSEPIGNLPGDFERISPDSLSALYEISFSAANVQASNLENRFAEIRSGSTGFTSSLNISNSPGALVEGSNGKAMIEPGKNVLTPSPENRWGVWVSGSGEFADVNGDGNGKGYEFTTGGVTFGLDYRLTKNFAVGVALGYAHTRTNLAGDGNIDVNSGRGGLYAAYSQDGFYLNGYAGGAYNSYDARRDAFGGAASGSTDSGEFDGYAGGGYEFHCGGFTVGPIASLEYSYVAVSGYTETGSLAPLNIVSQNQDSLRTNVGLSAAYTWKAGKVQLRPSLQASWQHEFSYSALPIEAQFASGAGGIFTVNGPYEGHDSALINAGVDVQWTPTLGTYFGYVGNVGRSNYDLNSIICSVRWDF
jgi:outer membrane autotransporter protein